VKREVIQPASEPAATRPCCARADVGELCWRCPTHPQATTSAAGLFFPVIGHVTSPRLAAAAMSISSLSVIANSLRLRRLPLP